MFEWKGSAVLLTYDVVLTGLRDVFRGLSTNEDDSQRVKEMIDAQRGEVFALKNDLEASLDEIVELRNAVNELTMLWGRGRSRVLSGIMPSRELRWPASRR